MRPADIEIHVEQLVLHGFRAQDRHAIAAGLESHLRQLLATQRLPANLSTSGGLASLNLGSFEVEPGSPPRAVGARLAQTLYERVSQ